MNLNMALSILVILMLVVPILGALLNLKDMTTYFKDEYDVLIVLVIMFALVIGVVTWMILQ
jgi:hypothetical protein